MRVFAENTTSAKFAIDPVCLLHNLLSIKFLTKTVSKQVIQTEQYAGE